MVRDADSTPLLTPGPWAVVTAFVCCGHLRHRGTRNRSTAPRPALQASWRR